jgi:hypothetical protein
MPFVLLVLVLLGGGLICLLVVNTTLGATSFRISQLQRTSATLTTQEQSLQQQIAAAQSPAQIAERAYQLGMRVQAHVSILDLRTGRSYKLPGQASVLIPLGAGSATTGPAVTARVRHPVKAATSKAGAKGKTGTRSRRTGSRR